MSYGMCSDDRLQRGPDVGTCGRKTIAQNSNPQLILISSPQAGPWYNILIVSWLLIHGAQPFFRLGLSLDFLVSWPLTIRNTHIPRSEWLSFQPIFHHDIYKFSWSPQDNRILQLYYHSLTSGRLPYIIIFSQALPAPADSSPSDLESKYAKLRAENPFPAKEPYIHVDGGEASSSAVEARGFFDSIFSFFGGGPKDEDHDAGNPSCGNDVECQTNEAIFSTDMKGFIEDHRNKGLNSPPLIYDADGCSVPAKVADFFKIDKDFPYGYEFLYSCYRHDFGYRNYKQQNRFTEPNRKLLDDNFEKDLMDQCKSQFPKADVFHLKQLFERKWCKTVAKVYYEFVRLCGGGGCKVETVKNMFKGIEH